MPGLEPVGIGLGGTTELFDGRDGVIGFDA